MFLYTLLSTIVGFINLEII